MLFRSVVQIASAVGRVIMGWLCDTLQNTALVLKWNASVLIVACAGALWMAPGWPPALVYALFAVLGFTTGAWAGTVLAEAGRLAPQEKLSAALSGMFVYLNTGKMIGPVIFANVYLATQSYGWAFASLALPGVAAWVWLHTNVRKIGRAHV